MYLSQCEINQNKRSSRFVLSSAQRIHAMVLSCFPRSLSKENGRVLWRIDRRKNGMFLLIVSKMKPDLKIVQEQIGWEQEGTTKICSYDSFIDRIKEGNIYYFRLTANPVYAKPVMGGKRGKTVPHTTVNHQKKWLIQRMQQYGFIIPDALDITDDSDERNAAFDIVERNILHFAKAEKSNKISISTATFEGLLKVTDAAKIKVALTGGIGKAKAYGCGLLTLIPLEQR